eukprot:TRINITY_DN2144_c0_g1_i1.p2 TRINITY_DN2144_c0_g1~~TRINITY_DN2144_c0_g1_i1.p2  ORF type:complete len:236 (-),score=123.88 TRINITY_DN2144_c0_g1_i1:12-719(-)
MALVAVTDVQVLDNPSTYLNPFQFEITFECVQDLSEDLEWKIVYIGSAESEAYDQVLDDILVGPVSAGTKKFVFQAPSPDISKLPDGEMLGVTAVLLTCSYRAQEFIRVGYYVNNELPGEENAAANAASADAANAAANAALAAAAAAASSSTAAASSSSSTPHVVAAVSGDTPTAVATDNDDDDDMDEDEEAVVEGIEVDNAPIAKRTGPVDPALVVRNILAAKPRVTRFQIRWD